MNKLLLGLVLMSQLVLVGCGESRKTKSAHPPAPADKTGPSGTLGVPKLDQKTTLVEGLDVFRDSLDENTFYFLPDSLSFVRDSKNEPMFTIMSVQDQGVKIHYLTMALLTRASDSLQTKIDQWKLENPKKKLELVQVRHLGLKVTEPAYFESVNLPSAPSVLGSEIGVNAVLTETGLTKFKEAATNGRGSVGLKSCYEYDGLDESNLSKTLEYCVELDFSQVKQNPDKYIVEE